MVVESDFFVIEVDDEFDLDIEDLVIFIFSRVYFLLVIVVESMVGKVVV